MAIGESPCVILYGSSVFLAGLQADLSRRVGFATAVVEADTPGAAALIRGHHPAALLFDLSASQPDIAVALLRDLPDLLLIGVDPSSNQLLVLSRSPAQAFSIADLIDVIRHKGEGGSR